MLPEKKHGRPSFNLVGLLLLTAVLMLCPIPAAAEDKDAISNTGGAICKDIKPFNNLEELLYQFYINLDSDCLFTMPVDVLEKMWGMKILSYDLTKSEEYHQLRMSADFYNKPYESEQAAFFIETHQGFNSNARYFYIKITHEFNEKYGTLFPDNRPFMLLPEPIQEKKSLGTIPAFPNVPRPCPTPIKNRKFSTRYSDYYWVSSDRNGKMCLTGGCGGTGLMIERTIKP